MSNTDHSFALRRPAAHNVGHAAQPSFWESSDSTSSMAGSSNEHATVSDIDGSRRAGAHTLTADTADSVPLKSIMRGGTAVEMSTRPTGTTPSSLVDSTSELVLVWPASSTSILLAALVCTTIIAIILRARRPRGGCLHTGGLKALSRANLSTLSTARGGGTTAATAAGIRAGLARAPGLGPRSFSAPSLARSPSASSLKSKHTPPSLARSATMAGEVKWATPLCVVYGDDGLLDEASVVALSKRKLESPNRRPYPRSRSRRCAVQPIAPGDSQGDRQPRDSMRDSVSSDGCSPASDDGCSLACGPSRRTARFAAAVTLAPATPSGMADTPLSDSSFSGGAARQGAQLSVSPTYTESCPLAPLPASTDIEEGVSSPTSEGLRSPTTPSPRRSHCCASPGPAVTITWGSSPRAWTQLD
uniref:Uncharacterized protein n=1 Tax=Coccolithus braarudii TaxID=221442 RepID=A0A7S0LPK3_9EUKA|mmetsp:Transcript_51542/g.110127  ORF Transcript_51542/g.110127 Transcript_51542/m.110127 type:complete len:417 (+) Transcript_51542:71-1321(+)|eukprot:CAMPEP_0183335310 /NCGR_PEP_ID=MMETSP0164_2-20130417/3655_1 /TAXON_ID=221442 /ORGANISM="Coccolithus pelagicus ssp braarudi, Strain PLY182g" /LENGTH=416 /DNA_ID=CAMNT_0025504655 /DNA_START=71 /DNA_END=1321 /DNA_ORIENTATION=+